MKLITSKLLSVRKLEIRVGQVAYASIKHLFTKRDHENQHSTWLSPWRYPKNCSDCGIKSSQGLYVMVNGQRIKFETLQIGKNKVGMAINKYF